MQMRTILILIFILVPCSLFANPPLIPTGGGGYVDPSNGTYYSSAGSAGIVNSRTGAFMSSTGGSGFVNSQTGAFVNAVPDATPSNPYASGGIYADTTSRQPLIPAGGSTPYSASAGVDYKPMVDKSNWGQRVRNNPRISKVIGANIDKVEEKPFRLPRGITFWRGKRIHAYCGGY